MGPLLVAHQGQEGPFPGWLEKLGLKDFLRSYPLTQLVKWGWLAPRHRVSYPKEFFMAWKNFPYLDSEVSPEFEAYSLLWDSWWSIDASDEPFWFLHPFFRPGDEAGNILTRKHDDAIEPVPTSFEHPNGRTVTPYADYFYHWQAYALIDVISAADCIAPLLNTPDIERRAAGMVRAAEYVKQLDPSDVLTTPRRWGDLAELMTWLSHYRSLREALRNSEYGHEQGRALRRAGAKQLADHLGITPERLTREIKERLLVLAQDWRWANERHNVWTMRAWPYLQRDIAAVTEWLCYLSGNTLDYFLDSWQYIHKGQEEWAQLHEVLPHEFFTDRQHFLQDAPYYLSAYNNLLPDPDRLENESLKELVDRLRSVNYPFDSFLGAFRQLHEELSYRTEEDGGLDFRELRPLDYYSIPAMRAEVSMRYAMQKSGLLKHIRGTPGLTTYIVALAQRRLSEEAIRWFKSNERKYTQLHNEPSDPIGAIMSALPNLGPKNDYLVRAFLCCVLARNYFAHHHYLDHELLRSEKSAFMLSGILVTVLFLLQQ